MPSLRSSLAALVILAAAVSPTIAEPGGTKPTVPSKHKSSEPKHAKKDTQPKPDETKPAEPTDKDTKKAEVPVTLKVGDKAPELQVDSWIKGDAVSSVTDGKVYVVEFWATWCPPCRESIPHLTQLQKEHKNDLTVIGVASSERMPKGTKPDARPTTPATPGATDDKRLDTLKKFVSDQGDKMDYRVAYDSDRQMAFGWMQPAGRNTIPTSFVIGHDGKIAWIGNPLEPAFDAAIAKAIKDAKAATPPAKPAT
jgi:thiol-disulfide isomerase/thioredoxin